MILLNTKEASDVPCNLLNRLLTIDGNTDNPDVAKDFFCSIFLNYLRKESQQQLIDAMEAEEKRKTHMEQCKQDALNIITQDSKEGFLHNLEQIKMFNEAKHGYFIDLVEKNELAEYNQYIEDISPFAAHIDLITLIWNVITKTVPKINRNISIDIDTYTRFITDCFARDGLMQKPSESQLEKLKKSLIISCLQMVFSALSVADSHIFAFHLAYSFKYNMVNEEGIDNVNEKITMLKKRFNEKIDYNTHKLPEKADASHFSSLGTADVFAMMCKYISDNVVEKFDTFIAPFQADSCVNSTNSQPTIVLTSPDADPTPVIQMYMMQRSRFETVTLVSLTSDEESVVRAERPMGPLA